MKRTNADSSDRETMQFFHHGPSVVNLREFIHC